MARATWKDTSSYSRGERGVVEPSIWELDLSGLRISVHRYHGLEGWFGSCYTMGVERKQLASSNLENAKAEFLRYLKNRAWNWADKIANAEVE